MGNFGPMELFLIFAIILVLFGAKKLPEIGSGLAKGIRSFRKNLSDEPTKDETLKESDASGDDTKVS